MKEHQILLEEIASMLQRQELLTKLTENVCLEEYSYSETHCIDYIGRTELPNVTKIAENMQMTFGPEQSVSIVFKGRSEHLANLTEGGFVASIDLTECIEPGEYNVPVIITEQPEGCDYLGSAKIKVTLTLKEVVDGGETAPDSETQPET